MKTALLLLLMTLQQARVEANLRWPDGRFKLLVDQTTPTYAYKLEITIDVWRPKYLGLGQGWNCVSEEYKFSGTDWQDVFDQSKNPQLRTNCQNPVNVKRP